MRIFSLIFRVILERCHESLERQALIGVQWTGWHSCSESCQALTKQATPPSQPQEIPRFQSQIFNHPSLSLHFSRVYVHIYMCMCACLLSLDKSNSLSDLHWRKVCFTALWLSVFSPASISNIADDRGPGGNRDLQGQTQVNTWALLCHSRDPSMLKQLDDEDQSTGLTLSSRKM